MQTRIRKKVLGFTALLVLVCLLGSGISVWKIFEVSRGIQALSEDQLPQNRAFQQLQADSEIFRKELERSQRQNDSIQSWLWDLLERDLERLEKLHVEMRGLRSQLVQLKSASQNGNLPLEASSFSHEAEKRFRQHSHAVAIRLAELQGTFSDLQLGLELVLLVVVAFSLLLIWLAERALLPLVEISSLARRIAERGLQKQDRDLLEDMPRFRDDEVSQLALEFHRMAGTLLERELIVQGQTEKLKLQNEMLAQMGELNAEIFRKIKTVFLVVDSDWNVTYWNTAALSLLKLNNEDLKKEKWNLRSYQTKVPFLDLARSPEVYLEYYRDEGLRTGHDHLELSWKIYVRKMQSEPELSERFLVSLEDLGEEMRLERLAAMGKISAQVAHEVRNPLHSIGLETEMALEALENQEVSDVKLALKSIQQSVERLEKITQDYLNLSKLSPGHKVKVHVVDLLQEVLATYMQSCMENSIRVDWDFSDEAKRGAFAELDRQLFEQVLGNLHKNAIQAVEKEGRILWTVRLYESNRIGIRVEDTGPGFSSELSDKVFEPFQTTKAQGSGLGLSFVKQVLDEQGGTIEIGKSSLGGALFEMMIPAAGELYEVKNESVPPPFNR